MATHGLGELSRALPERMFVLRGDLREFLALRPLMRAVHAFDREAIGEAGEGALGALNQVVPRVRARGCLIPLHHDRLALHGLDDRRVHVAAAAEIEFVPLVVGGKVLLAVQRASSAGRREGREAAELVVSARDAHILRDRTEAVAGIEIAVAARVVIRAPRSGAPIHFFHLRAQVVNVCGFGMEEFAEQTATHHVQIQQLFAAVTHVLHQHAVAARLFGRVHQVPHFLQGDGNRNFDEGVRAPAHRRDAHRRVQFPRRGDEHRIRLRLGQHRAPAVGIAEVHLGGVALFLRPALRATRQVLVQVTDADHLGAFDGRQLCRVAGAPSAHANQRDTHLVEFRRGKIAAILRAGSPCRRGRLGTCHCGQRRPGSDSGREATKGLEETTARVLVGHGGILLPMIDCTLPDL